MNTVERINIAEDFTIHPGPRYEADGEFSGERFLKELLRPKFEQAVQQQGVLLIDLDRVYGYPSSFVSGSFGLLSIEKGASTVLKHIKFKSEDNNLRLERIKKEIADPKKQGGL